MVYVRNKDGSVNLNRPLNMTARTQPHTPKVNQLTFQISHQKSIRKLKNQQITKLSIVVNITKATILEVIIITFSDLIKLN